MQDRVNRAKYVETLLQGGWQQGLRSDESLCAPGIMPRATVHQSRWERLLSWLGLGIKRDVGPPYGPCQGRDVA